MAQAANHGAMLEGESRSISDRPDDDGKCFIFRLPPEILCCIFELVRDYQYLGFGLPTCLSHLALPERKLWTVVTDRFAGSTSPFSGPSLHPP